MYRLSRTFAAAAIFISLTAVSCRKNSSASAVQERTTWYTYTYSGYDGTLYISIRNGMLNCVICGSAAGINCSLKLNHICTPEQFDNLRPNLEKIGCKYLGTAAAPNTEGYPDLSQYLSFVISSNELHQLWEELGLESPSG